MNGRTSTGLHASGWRVVGAALLLAVVAASGGCLHKGATTAANAANNAAPLPVSGTVSNADRYKVTADTTSFFRYGPQQLNGSDLDLKKEARITMVKRGRGYSQIRMADGQVGYVGTEDIAPLSAQEIAAEDAAKIAAAQNAAAAAAALAGPGPGAGGGPSYNSGPPVTIPPEAGRSESLPTHDPGAAATPPPSTIFRY